MPTEAELETELAATRARVAELEEQLAALRRDTVETWVRTVLHDLTVPLVVERSFSWRVTKPFRMATLFREIAEREGLASSLAYTGRWVRKKTTGRD